MSVPNSVEELLGLVRKSGMVEEPRLTAYLHDHPVGRGAEPQDPREYADQLVRDAVITGFQKEQFLLGKWRGFTIGKYKLLERVGVGGMGQVFLCEHMLMKRRVAIKVLPPAKAEQPAALGRFYREARAAGSLEHPNIVRTHDIDQDGNLHFIVMEYVDGSNLLDIVKKFGPMDVRRATFYARQIAVGLDFAFRNGIIHRDIKPGNVLIDRLGQAKILDMGLARFYKDTSDMLTVKYDDKIVLGTADYVAPEQVANSHSADVRADIYALGASFYFLLAGHPPFPQGTVSQKLTWHRTKDPTPIRQLRPEVPEALAAIVQKMLMKDPNQRYQSPAEVAMELERWVPASVPPPDPEEMPTLSPAARDQTPPPDPETMPTPDPDPPRAVPAAGGGRPFGPQSSGVRPNLGASPFGPPGGTPGPSSGAYHFRETQRPSVASGVFRNPAPAGPFAAPQSEVPTNGRGAFDPTPADLRVPVLVPTRPSSGSMSAAVAPAGPSNGHKYLIGALLALCAILAVGMVYVGAMYLKLATPAAP